MAVLNFIYAGRVYLDESKKTTSGYWGISLALNCFYVYPPDKLSPRVRAEFEKADHELDYIVNQPTDQLYRLACTEHTDIVFSQKGVFSLISSVAMIPHKNIKRLEPNYKYQYSTGFGIPDIVKDLTALSVLTMNSPTGLFGTDKPTEAFPTGTRRRFIMQEITQATQRVQVPYGITGVRVSTNVQYLVIPETVEYIELRSGVEIDYIAVVNKYFTQNLLAILGLHYAELGVNNIRALNTDTLILSDMNISGSIECSGEVRLFPGAKPYNGTQLHINPAMQYVKPQGVLA